MAYVSGNETRDGGQTPGPYEEMRRRMAGMHASTPISLSPTSGGIRKKGAGKKREKKRRWVWTIGKDAEDAELEECGSPVVAPWTAGPVLSSVTTEKKEAMAVAMGVPVLAVPMPPSIRARMRAQTLAQSSGQAVIAGDKAAAGVAAVTGAMQIPKLPVPVPGPPTAGRRLRPALSLPSMSLPPAPVSAYTPVATVAPALPLVQQPSPPPQEPQPQQHQPHKPSPLQQQQEQPRATVTPEPTSSSQQNTPVTEARTPSMESVTSMTSSSSTLSHASSSESFFEDKDSDSVFDTSSVYNGDVEMSDASSVWSAGDNEGEEETKTRMGGAYEHYLKVNSRNFRLSGVIGGTTDQPVHSSDMDTDQDMDMDMDTPTVGGRPGYAVERLGLGIC